MMWCGDFNQHHPLWDEEWNHHLFMTRALCEAEELLEKVGDYNMMMILPKDIPTLKAMATKNWMHPNNVFCSTNTEELVVICNTDLCLRGPGTDHVPILTILELPAPRINSSPTYNFWMTDWDDFREELGIRIADIPAPTIISNNAQFQAAVQDLTWVLQDVICMSVPMSKPSPHAKHWWKKELLNLKKKKKKLSSVSYKNCTIQDHLSHAEHRQVRNKYGEAIIQAKQGHWNDFLKDVSNRDVWIANRDISSSSGNGGKTCIPMLMSNLTPGITQSPVYGCPLL
jgi:hypothetical protein